uniref:ANK_REP_REGION domain-containing protein n=1 Tax=Anopheles dirus TaxID=7168 RepID=A0A182N5J3_9DIPT
MTSATIELQELRNAFDRFSIWILARHESTAAAIHLLHGKIIHPELCNYLVAIATGGGNGAQLELSLLECYLTKAQFVAIPERTRKDAIERVTHYINGTSNIVFKHYLHIINDWPPMENVETSIILLKTSDLITVDLSHFSDYALCRISATREMPDARIRNVYDIGLRNGQTIRDMIRQTVASKPKCNLVTVPENPYYHTEAKPVNGINLEELTKVLNSSEGRAPLGLFLVRQAELKDIKCYVKKYCVDRLEDVTRDTWFLVSETVPFETPFPEHSTVHEVAHLKDYSIVFWLRSRGPSACIGKHFTVHWWDAYDSTPPAPGWLNVLVSNVTDGSSTYLHQLAAGVRQTDPFRMVVMLQAVDMVELLQQPNADTIDEQLYSFFYAKTDEEKFAVATGKLMLLVDHAMTDNRSLCIAKALVQFLNALDGSRYRDRITIWIVGDDLCWAEITSNCKHAAIKHAMPKLRDEQRTDCLARMLKDANREKVEKILEKMVGSNSRSKEDDLFGNVFIIAVIAESINDCADETTWTYWWVEAMEHFVWKHIAPEASNALKEFEQHCFERSCATVSDRTERSSMQSRTVQHRTIRNLLAARYLTHHAHLIDLECYRRFDRDIIDALLFRSSPAALAVLHHDVESVRQCTVEELKSVTDCLQRNLLHVAHASKDIQDILLSGDIPVDQQCAQWNNWTPLLAAIDRNDWPFVDRLLAKGAVLLPQHHSKLHTMSQSELEEVFCDCIVDNCTTLINWVLEHRADYLITQQNIYTLSAFEEFEQGTLFHLLALAQEQRLPEREPPYRFIFDNSALDNAVEDERLELAVFLVERLNFPATEEFQELRARHIQQKSQLKEYQKLFELCRTGERVTVSQMIEANDLDPQYKHGGTNLLIQAATSGNVELVQYLVENHGFDEQLNDPDDHGCTAMSEALAGGHQSIVQYLVAHGATVQPDDQPDLQSDASVEIDTNDFLALIQCSRAKLEQLGIDYQRYDGGDLLLHFYIRYEDEPNEETFRFLLSQYADIDVRTSIVEGISCGETPLHVALKFGNKRCTEVLLELGADIYAKSLKHGLTSLHFAIMGNMERSMIQRLIDVYGFDINTADERGRTISFYMPLKQDLYRWLIDQYRFDPSASDNDGQTLLHHRVIKQSFFARPKIEFLLQMPHFSQSHTDNRGRLPLHYAVEAGHLTIVRLLAKYRQDLFHIADSEGCTPVQLGKNLNHAAISEFFHHMAQ